MVMKPRRSGAAVEGITRLKQGAAAFKYPDEEKSAIGMKQKPHLKTFKLDDDETTVSWEATTLGKVFRAKSNRSVLLDDVLELQVGDPNAAKEDLFGMERTLAFSRTSDGSRESKAVRESAAAFGRPPTSPQHWNHHRGGGGAASSSAHPFGPGGGGDDGGAGGAGGAGGVLSKVTKAIQQTKPAACDMTQTHLRLNLRLIGSLPAPPTEDGSELPASEKPREYLTLQCTDEEALGFWLAALRTLLNERKPPSPIGPEALMGSFGTPLDEVALADASIAGGLLIPAVLEALWLALAGRTDEDALSTEGIFRLSAAGSELNEVRRRIQEAEETEEAIKGCSTICIAALIKLYMRELPGQLWLPVRGQLLDLVEGPPPPPAAPVDVGDGPLPGARAKVAPIVAAGSAADAGDEAAPEAPGAADAAGATPEDAEKDRLGQGLRALITQLPRRSADLIIWTCDVMAAVVAREEDNRMSPTAIAAVVAPVLMRGLAPEDGEAASDPLAALKAAQHGTKLAEALLAAHRHTRLTRK